MSDILDGISEHEPLDLEPIKARKRYGTREADEVIRRLIAEVEYLRAVAELDAIAGAPPTECGACGTSLICPNCGSD